MEIIYNSIIIFSSVTALSTWIYCKMQDKNFIYIYYKPTYLMWMFITYFVLGYKIIHN